MYKVYSSCLLLTLAFSNAHAPTFQLWRELATASAEVDSTSATSYLDSHASFQANDAFAAGREYAEDNDLKRFGVDEFYLPKIEVDEPELFNWSQADRTYLASNTLPASFGYLDSATIAAFRSGGASSSRRSGFLGGASSGGASGGSQMDPSAALSSKGASSQSNGETATDTSEPNEGDSNQNVIGLPPADDQFAVTDPGIVDLLPIDPTAPPVVTTPIDQTIVEEQKPVQVPVPGAFGLFALGLAALRLVGRKKNGSG